MSVTVVELPSYNASMISDKDLAERYGDQTRWIIDRFASCRVGGMLLLKLAGFIEDERAEVLSISESHVTLQLGGKWYRRWVSRAERRRPIEVHIQFADPDEDPAKWQKANARRSMVEVRVRPLSPTFPTREFQRRADSILRMLRLHFVAD